MKNVTPKAGQVWECDVIGGMSTRKIRTVIYNTPYHHDVFFECGNHMNTRDLWGCGTFIPQSDLEWLAVNVNHWVAGADYNLIRRHKSDEPVWSKTQVDNYKHCTRRQWQNMRYELGLDEPKNKITWANCPFPTITINCPCTMTPLPEVPAHMYCRCSTKLPLEPLKETKMIDLSEYKVNDKFDWIGNDLKGIAELVYISAWGHYVFDCPADSEDTSAVIIVVDDKGHSVYDNFPHQFIKHDPRHWLSQLPDADDIAGDNIACDKSNSAWYAYSGEPIMIGDGFESENGFECEEFGGIKMPTLTGDEWRDSKISIVELRAWQEQVK